MPILLSATNFNSIEKNENKNIANTIPIEKWDERRNMLLLRGSTKKPSSIVLIDK
ncbi:hypothetical protein VEGS17_A12500 [Escherichia coli]|nr:hypothetical protein VEGS17_A12500 [Escherichia coli]